MQAFSPLTYLLCSARPNGPAKGGGAINRLFPTLRQVDESTCQGRAEKFRIFPKMETRRVHPIGSLEEFEF